MKYRNRMKLDWVVPVVSLLTLSIACDEPASNTSVSSPAGASGSQNKASGSASSGASQSSGEADESSGGAGSGDASEEEGDAGASAPGAEAPPPAAAEEAPAAASGGLTVTSHQIDQSGGTLTLNRYGRVMLSSMRTGRARPGFAHLSDGRLMVLGGYMSSALFGTMRHWDSEFFSAASGLDGLYEAGARFSMPLYGQKIVALPAGKALIMGGTSYSGGSTALNDATTSAWIYDPSLESGAGGYSQVPGAGQSGCTVSASWNAFSPMQAVAFGGTLATGSAADRAGADAQWKVAVLSESATQLLVYDSQTGCFRAYDLPQVAASVLRDYRLVGLKDGRLFIFRAKDSLIFDPAGEGSFVTDLPDPAVLERNRAGVVRLGDGKVAILGGCTQRGEACTAAPSIEVFDPVAQSFTTVTSQLREGMVSVNPAWDSSTQSVVLIGGHQAQADSTLKSSVETAIDAWDPATDQLAVTGLALDNQSWGVHAPLQSDNRSYSFAGLPPVTSLFTGALYWAGSVAAGGMNSVQAYEPQKASAVNFTGGDWANMPYHLEILEGEAEILYNDGFSVSILPPFRAQERIRVKLTGKDGKTGEFSFSVGF